MPTGASGGYVLTSDENGNGTWQPAPEPDANTKSLSIIGGAFLPANPNRFFQRSTSLLSRDSDTDYFFYCPVHLPHDATITEIRVCFRDEESSHDITVSLNRTSLTGTAGDKMAEIVSSGDGNVRRTLWDNSVDYPTVNNLSYAYSLKAEWWTGVVATLLEIYYVQILYIE